MVASSAMCVPSMGTVQMGFKSPVYKPEIMKMNTKNTSRSQGVASDRRSERRLCKTRVPMNKNLIEGRCDGASWHNTAKPTGEVVEVNQAVVRGRTVFLPGEVSPVRAGEKSAAVIVVRDKPGAAKRPFNRSIPANWTP
jgi:hypothetical protein